MKFLVIWDPTAYGRAVDLSQTYPGHPALGAAFGTMAAALEGDPLDAGESREGDARLAFFGPLAVQFRIDAARRRVYVLNVYLTAPLP